MAERFVKIFEPYDAVVTPSGSCAAMVRHYYPTLFAGHALEARAKAVAARTFEISEFLVDQLHVTNLGTTLTRPTRACLHDACHGLRGLGIGAQPRALLANVGNLSVADLPQHDQCCGFGGLFAVKMSEISGAMLADKLRNIEAGDAEIVITGDASCLMHMNGGLSRGGSKRRVVHLAEVLAGRV